jgi:hypothetical protein
MRRAGAIIGILVIVTAMTAAAPAGSMSLNVIYGTNGHDTIVATPAADVIYAKSGNDRITNVGDNDVVWASSGNDTVTTLPLTNVSNVVIEANVGHDKIENGLGGRVDSSFINGGSGNDQIRVRGCNEVRGESGNDVYENLAGCSTGNTANLGDGHDRAVLLYASEVLLGNGNDRLDTRFPGYVHSGSGNDRMEIELGGNATVYMGTGHDELDIETAGGVTAYGSNGNDRVTVGHGGSNILHGQSGNDTFTIEETSVNNALFGGTGRDKARLDVGSSGSTCDSIETVVDFAGARRSCS